MPESCGLELVRCHAAALARRDLDRLCTLLAPEAALFIDGWAQPLRGRLAVRRLLAALFWLYPDYRPVTVHMHAAGDRVRVRRWAEATLRDGIPPRPETGFAGVPATGRRVAGYETELLTIRGGRITGSRLHSDLLASPYTLERLFFPRAGAQAPVGAGPEPAPAPPQPHELGEV